MTCRQRSVLQDDPCSLRQSSAWRTSDCPGATPCCGSAKVTASSLASASRRAVAAAGTWEERIGPAGRCRRSHGGFPGVGFPPYRKACGPWHSCHRPLRSTWRLSAGGTGALESTASSRSQAWRMPRSRRHPSSPAMRRSPATSSTGCAVAGKQFAPPLETPSTAPIPLSLFFNAARERPPCGGLRFRAPGLIP
jgi:hypothetical protein